MNKINFLFIFIFTYSVLNAKIGDTVKVTFFLDSNIQQYKGPEWHRIAQKIPKGNYSKAWLKVDIGCATYGCCAWDYTYRGFFSKRINDTGFHDIEVGRFITPYSSFMRKNRQGYDSTWSHPYIYDVTDFLPLLADDSIIYSAHTGGWDDKGKFGFKHTVTLYLLKGETINNPTRVMPMLQNAYRYHDSSQFDQLIKPYKFKLTKDEKYAKFRIIFTGHDQQGEFSPIPFYVILNGKEIYKKRLWKTDCDQNAIQPQSGTWIFSRCNWCPGEKVYEVEVDLTQNLIIGDNEIDIRLGKIVTQDSQINANYLIEGDIIMYPNKYQNDIELMAIVAPSSDPNFRLENPIGFNPKLKIKNIGANTIYSIKVNFWSDRDSKKIYSNHFDKQNLKPYGEMTIELGHDLSKFQNNEKLIFAIEKSLQNTNSSNDTLVTYYKSPSKFKSKKLIFETATSGDSSINNLFLRNSKNEVVLKKEYLNYNIIYRDTLEMPVGAYEVELTDYDKNYECGDGLSFWYSSRVGKKTSGIFKIVDAETNRALKVFNPDFGGKIKYQFILNAD